MLDRFLPTDPAARHRLHVWGFRVLAVADILIAVYYFSYRYTATLNPDALWFAIPLVLAETYAIINTLLFIIMLWRPTLRVAPPAPDGASVDVFIATYNEPLDIVRKTASAAIAIRYPHQTYVLDDGDRPEMRAMCEEQGCGYITRGAEWKGRARHAKAGNVNNALAQTSGDFILVLDADQITAPQFLDRVLGYFSDPKVAFVQTPQHFYNVPPGDPFGSDAPLFYGPIMQGKDGWNAAFFCGSNGVLRREALFQLGLVTYVQETDRRVREALKHLPDSIMDAEASSRYRAAATQLSAEAKQAVGSLKYGEPLGAVLDRFQRALGEAQRTMVAGDLSQIARDLADVEAMEQRAGSSQTADVATVRQTLESGLLALSHEVSRVAAPPVDALGIAPEVGKALQVTTEDALDVQPMATFSITEDMATAMRLHALGWKSVFHPEIMAEGLAPEDLGSALGQRLRWGAGTIQVLVRDNPLTKPGLTLAQRIQYFGTIYSYFSGFASVVFLVAPAIYLLFGISPVAAHADEFLIRILPYLVINRLMFAYATWGIEVVRGEQYSLALFPLWIQAIITVLMGRKLTFQVTPKTRQTGRFTHLIIPQIVIVGLLAVSIIYGFAGIMYGWRTDDEGVLINIFWATYDILMLYVILNAAEYLPKPSPRTAPAG